ASVPRDARAADVHDPGRGGSGGGRRGRPPGSRGRGVGPPARPTSIPRMALINRHRLWQAVADAALIAIAWWGAFELRFEGHRPLYDRMFAKTIFVVIAVKVAVLLVSGTYTKWWRYIALRDMQAIG